MGSECVSRCLNPFPNSRGPGHSPHPTPHCHPGCPTPSMEIERFTCQSDFWIDPHFFGLNFPIPSKLFFKVCMFLTLRGAPKKGESPSLFPLFRRVKPELWWRPKTVVAGSLQWDPRSGAGQEVPSPEVPRHPAQTITTAPRLRRRRPGRGGVTHPCLTLAVTAYTCRGVTENKTESPLCCFALLVNNGRAFSLSITHIPPRSPLQSAGRRRGAPRWVGSCICC